MRILRDEPRDAAQAEASAEPVDEMRKLRRMIGRRQAGLCRFAALGDERGEAQHVVAEARIDLVTDHAEPVREQVANARSLAQRLAGADLDAKHLAVGAEQRGLQQPRAFAAPLQQCAELCGELLDGAEHVAFQRDRLGEALLGDGRRNGQARRDRLVLAAERLIDAAHELRTEACRERRTRAVEHVGDTLQPDLGESFEGFGGKSQRSEGEGRDYISLFARGNGPHPVGFADHPPPLGEGLENRATPHAQPTVSAIATRACRPWRVQPPHQIVRQRRLAAEQMRATGNIEGQPVGLIESTSGV